MAKYIYYRVIQTNHGYGWDDDDFHESYSSGFPKDYKAFRENLKLYRQNCLGAVRTITRRELKESNNQ